MSESRRLALPVFVLTETCEADVPDAMERTIITKSGSAPTLSYFCRPVEAMVGSFSFNNVHIVVDSTGMPWYEACLYIMSRLEGYTHPKTSTFTSIADDLSVFRRFLDEEDIDYTIFHRRKPLRPTYRFKGDLETRVRTGELSSGTARRRMQTVIGFYRWLVSEKRLIPDNPLWKDGDAYINFVGSGGQKVSKHVKTTDVAIKSPDEEDPTDGTINDGGKLKPLSIDIQEALFRTLRSLGNTEMTLAHSIADFTGSRIQTVLTFRVRHFRLDLPDHVDEVPLVCGPGTSIDTKNDKKITLFFPRWLYEQLRVYSYSQRAAIRREKSQYGDTEDAYLFLSQQGNPFYLASCDKVFDPQQTTRSEPCGAAVRVFIRDRVLPLLRAELGQDFHYQFHDLRASFGMNLTDSQQLLVEQGVITQHEAREFVRKRMCHSRTTTTDLYLGFREKNKIRKEIQKNYEDHLSELTELARSGDILGIS